MTKISRAELAKRVIAKLISDGMDLERAEAVVRPGFFLKPDGLEVLARKLGVVADDEELKP